jgi:hypothetical protein
MLAVFFGGFAVFSLKGQFLMKLAQLFLTIQVALN